MKSTAHRLSINTDRLDGECFVSLKAEGKLTHADYQVITPIIDSALAKVTEAKMKVFFDGIEFEGWELRAAWDDLKLGFKHGSKFHKIAIYGDKAWQKVMAKIGGWFIAGEVKFFDQQQDALTWLNAS